MMVVHERVVVVSVKKRKKGTRAEEEAREYQRLSLVVAYIHTAVQEIMVSLYL